ncbi:MAG: MarR family winged helix-turn-helix transcriptional regulator [Candidatus Hermodarchaeota archaeon]
MITDEELVHKILESISRMTFLEQRRVVIFNKTKLYPSEIHLLLSISEGHDTNVTKIAEHFGLTKGAVSQTLSRLQKKGLIKKDLDTKKKNELHILYTNKGEELIKHIINMKMNLGSEYLNFIKKLSEKEKQAISDFLDKMVTILYKHHKS